ncbi:MAG: prolyl oligopeptidase family serine peptidase, partial [Myxococcales bacterium]|nr:prolyl oligopeptidase family serine peptidase [Myxococcales bacterium]
HGRHGAPPTGAWGGAGPTPRGAPMIVIAPEARGQTHYRHAGEIDVLEAMADVRARYPVDASRIYVTGGSMGGTGAAYLPFRHPDLFAASASLAGYHDQRVRQDTHHEGLTTVERFLVAHRSDVDWAENALHLPMLLVRGTRDRPLAWTRSLASRLDALRASGGLLAGEGQSRLPGGPRRGYASEHREPELGHNVWTETYAGGAIFTWLGAHARPSAPRDVRLRTARERTRDAFWVRDVVRAAADRFADVDARVVDGEVHVRTRDVASLALTPAPPLVAPGPLTVHVDGQTIVAAATPTADGPRLDLRREGDTWVVGARSLEGRKRPGVSGPIRDVYHEPLVFVVGTRDPDHTWINRRVAEHWASPRGWDVAYPIVDDVDVTPAMIEGSTLVLVGPPRSNALHARWRHQLPIRFVEAPLPDGRLVMDGAIAVGRARHAGAQVGAAFVAPNPDVSSRSVLVLAGTTPLGTWRARFLPDILPDYVVFDGGVENAREWWSCGGARFDDGSENGSVPAPCAYRAHGFFDMEWRLRAGGAARD